MSSQLTGISGGRSCDSHLPLQPLVVTHGNTALQHHHDSSLQIVVPSRSLSANRSFIAVTSRDTRYHRDRYLRTADLLRSHSASRGTFAIAHGESQFRRDHLTDRGTIATAISESRYHRDRSCDSRYHCDRSCDPRQPCDRSRESLGIPRNRSRQIAASVRLLSRIAGSWENFQGQMKT